MTFERSPHGQANRAIFYDVDWIIYTEGGSEQNDVARSFDALFWAAVFNAVAAPLRFRAVPKGGKPQLLPLAERVAQGEFENVIVAMDRDYDEIFGKMIDHHRVVYTLGYSFENDIYTKDKLYELADAIFPEICDLNKFRRTLKIWVDSINSNLRWAIKADLLAVHLGLCAFDREKPQKYLRSNAYGSEPGVSIDRVRAEVTRIRTDASHVPKTPLGLVQLDVRMIYGHLWECFVYRALACLHDRHSMSPKLTYEGLRSFAISQFQVILLRDAGADDLSAYYLAAVNRALNS